MYIDVSQVLSVKDKQITLNAPIEMETFQCDAGNYRLEENNYYDLTLTHTGARKFMIEGSIMVHLMIPCDKCLEEVNTVLDIPVSKEIDLSDDADADEIDENRYYVDDQSMFHLDRFVYNEILVNLPMKVLCKPDCKGICYRCGTNLNYKSCDCDTKELDPRMAKVLDVFKQFKEV